MKTKKKSRFPDYDVVNLKKETGHDIVTFGTTLFIRKDKLAIKIVFPCGDCITFCLQDEIK